ncbi:MAG: hypothetical protein JWN88_718 [Frankiales bacterium]|nr:hypothetical protein [Frankiales bacterium]
MSELPAPRSTAAVLLDAARVQLMEDGFAGLSTRKVADRARVPLSQVHYHFGSKSGLVLALLHSEDARRLARQTEMYAADVPLWRRYEQACDFLDEDLESGYVRVLHEMVAAGWSDPALAQAAREVLLGWHALLVSVAHEAAEQLGGLGPFTPEEVASLIGNAFLGSEALLLLGVTRQQQPVRSSLRRIGQALRAAEEAASGPPRLRPSTRQAG